MSDLPLWERAEIAERKFRRQVAMMLAGGCAAVLTAYFVMWMIGEMR